VAFFKKKPLEVVEYRDKDIDPYLQASSHDESNWLMSYADIMTLLCGFFIMLFSFAKLDTEKYEKVRESVSKQFGGDFKSAHAEYARFLHQVIEKNGLDKEASVHFGAEGVSLVFQSTTFFDTLSADISADGSKTLEPFFAEITRIQTAEGKHFKVAVEGHTDSRKIISGPYPSNWELSSARAARVVRAFIDHGFDPKRLVAIGYADTRPERLEPVGTVVTANPANPTAPAPEATHKLPLVPTVEVAIAANAAATVTDVNRAPAAVVFPKPDVASAETPVNDRDRRVVIRIIDDSAASAP
jgi:chemotaxis protein MotB